MLRVVSLVPSVTETLLALGVTPVACTRFCEQPGLHPVGGTKNPDVDAIAQLRPDLVVVNDEENRLTDVEAMRARGLALHDMSPRDVAAVGPAVGALAEAVGVAVPAGFGPEAWAEFLARTRARTGPVVRRGFTAVWRRPWMTLSAATYGSSVMELIGVENVFAMSPVRYPETTLPAVAARRPDVVLLPTEPYSFTDRHVAEVAEALPGAAVVLVDGQDLFWWGIRTPGAVGRLARRLAGEAPYGGEIGSSNR